MLPPPEFEASAAPKPADESICVITGRAAKYKDPDTGLPYADVNAYQELQVQLRQGAARSLKKQHANNAGRKPKREGSGESLRHLPCSSSYSPSQELEDSSSQAGKHRFLPRKPVPVRIPAPGPLSLTGACHIVYAVGGHARSESESKVPARLCMPMDVMLNLIKRLSLPRCQVSAHYS